VCVCGFAVHACETFHHLTRHSRQQQFSPFHRLYWRSLTRRAFEAPDAAQTPIPQVFAKRGARLSDDGAGGGGLVLPGRGQDTDRLVVTGQTVDTGLDENEAELGVLVLAVALEVLADGDSLEDE